MNRFKTFYFIYDADGGIFNKIKYWLNKNILKKNTACELCDISHGKFFVRLEWLDFIRELEKEYKVEVLHRNELPKKIREKNFQYPCVIGETNSEIGEVFTKAEFRDFENLTNVRELREQFLGRIS